jgi:hypothetical protein
VNALARQNYSKVGIERLLTKYANSGVQQKYHNRLPEEVDRVWDKISNRTQAPLAKSPQKTWQDFNSPGETMRAIWKRNPKPPKWFIHNLLYVGLTLLSGPPKLGKSFLLMWLAHHLAEGLPFWDMATRQCKVLAIFLEDGDSRINKRIRQLLDEEEPSDNLTVMFSDEVPTMAPYGSAGTGPPRA